MGVLNAPQQERRHRQEPSDVTFHFGDRHLGFLADGRMSTSRNTGSGTIKKLDPVIRTLLICPGVKYPHVASKRSKKLLPEELRIYRLQWLFSNACVQNDVYAQNESIFTCSHRDLKSFPGTETPDPTTGVGRGEEGRESLRGKGMGND